MAENATGDVHEESLPEKIITEDDTPVEDTIVPGTQPVNENMEVHHHAHHGGRKNWKSYFWEFLMLFLAVFCGFLAEYQLEHKIEKDRAKELARSFYEELKNDSVNAQLKQANRIRQETSMQYRIDYFRDSNINKPTKAFAINFAYGVNFRTPTQFEPRTIILDQLRNSGSLRYFKNEEFQKLTGDLTVAIKNIYNRQELEFRIRMEYLNPILIQHSDFSFDNKIRKRGRTIFEGMQDYEKGNDTIPYQLNNIEKIDRKAIVNLFSYYIGNVVTSTRQIPIQNYIETNEKLLKLLREEYHIKDQGESNVEF